MYEMKTKPKLFCQCELQRHDGDTIHSLITNIEPKYAKIGTKLHVAGHDGEWVVVWAGESRTLPDAPRQAIRKHRKRTGDAAPKK
jgi:hypothetical protein